MSSLRTNEIEIFIGCEKRHESLLLLQVVAVTLTDSRVITQAIIKSYHIVRLPWS
jgi:hypothetical protein